MPQLRVESEKIIESSVRVCIPPMRANIKKPSTCASVLYAKDCKSKKQKKTSTHQGSDTRFDWKKKQKVSQVNKDQTNSSQQTENTIQCKDSNCDSLLEIIETNKQCNQTSSTVPTQYLEELTLFDLDIDPESSLECESKKSKNTDDETEISDQITELYLSSSLDSNKRFVFEDQTIPAEQHNESNLKSTPEVVKNSAERFFLESGILGTMGLASSILKKSSKINPILNDSNIKEVVSRECQMPAAV